MKDLSLPKYDGREDPTGLKRKLLATKDDEQDEERKKEAEKKRQEYMLAFQQKIAKTENIQLRKGSAEYWRGITKTIIILQRIYKEVVTARL